MATATPPPRGVGDEWDERGLGWSMTRQRRSAIANSGVLMPRTTILEVKDRGGLRCGIAILHRIDRSVHIVGAGRPVGNGKDEVPCRVGWGVQPAHYSHRDGTSSPDLLYVVAEWDQGGWLVWNGTTYVWVAWN